MPIQPTYPGVYIQEIPSGVRTIVGVATSITAFIGIAPKGPVDDPIVINNFGDYERQFGGLDPGSTMSYAVRDFYSNGGAQAVIVRVAADDAEAATITLAGDDGATVLEAASVGTWGGNLRAKVDYLTRDPSLTDFYNLTVQQVLTVNGETSIVGNEIFRNVSNDPADPRYIATVLRNESSLARVRVTAGADDVGDSRPHATTTGAPPVASFVNATTGDDGTPPGANEYRGSATKKTGLHALDNADQFNLLCIPPPARGGDTNATVWSDAATYCAQRRAMLIVDPPAAWGANRDHAVSAPIAGLSALGPTGPDARNAALYYPLVIEADPLRANQLDQFVPCGIVAGIFARTDAARGVWKAPAGLDAALNGVQALQVKLTDSENGQLNQLGINCFRQFPVSGRVAWGARTLRGADALADEYKYIPVRRTALYIEESLYRGTQWVVFEPNDEPLWAQIRLNVGAFMHDLFRQGAFQGASPRDAYLVKCDSETTTQSDINSGIVNVLVGFAPLKPAEFVFIKIQQLAGQIEV